MTRRWLSMIGFLLPSLGLASKQPEGLVFQGLPDLNPPTRVSLPVSTNSNILQNSNLFVYTVSGPEDFNQGSPLAHADSNGNFIFALGSLEFAEVNAFYHLNNFLNYFKSMGFKGFSKPVPIALNFLADTSIFPYAGATLIRGAHGLFVTRDSRVNFALDTDVLFHELFHVLHGELAPGWDSELDHWGWNLVPGSIGEAVADYFAASFNGDPNVGEYSGSKIGLETLSGALDHNLSFPGTRIGASHYDGQVVAGALWTLREKLGRQKVDPAVLGAILDSYKIWQSTLKPAQTSFGFRHFAHALIQRLSHLSKNEFQIVEVELSKRGLLAEDRFLLMESTSGWLPLAVPAGAVLESVHGTPSTVQLKLTIPKNSQSLKLKMSCYGDEGESKTDCLKSMTLHLRSESPVEFSKASQTRLRITSDWKLKATGEMALPTGALKSEVVYASILNSGEQSVVLMALEAPSAATRLPR